MIRLAIYGALIVAIVSIVGGGYAWLQYMVDKQAQLAAANAAYAERLDRTTEANKQLADTLRQTTEEWTAHQEETNRVLDRLSRATEEATAETVRLRSIFNKHDLERLSLAKPRLIQRRVNTGSARAVSLLNAASREASANSGKGGGSPAEAGDNPRPATGTFERERPKVGGSNSGNRKVGTGQE